MVYFSLEQAIPASIPYGFFEGNYYYSGTLYKREIVNIYGGNGLIGHEVYYSGVVVGTPIGEVTSINK